MKLTQVEKNPPCYTNVMIQRTVKVHLSCNACRSFDS